MILVGELALWVAFLMAAWSTTVSFAGGAMRRGDLVASGERGAYATFAFVLLAAVGMWTAIFSHDFSIKYVAWFTGANLPKPYLFTALWAGQAGSMLFWCLILSGFGAVAVWTNRSANRELMPYVTGTLAATTLFFLATLSPGPTLYEPPDGIRPAARGMTPHPQNRGMAILPPNLYLGYVATTVP